jgi:CubicO group peptidase (beta-lactamase class C family)
MVLADGTHTYDSSRPVRSNDLFDLASLTKVIGTTSIAMHLHDRAILDLDAPVADLFPQFSTDPGKSAITVAHLLAHCSGLPAWLPFHHDPSGSQAERRQRVLDAPLASPVGEQTVYSDIGMMVLGILLEELGGLPLADLVQREVCQPLGMAETGYLPSPALKPRILPTECKDDGAPLHGIVHDENARWLGGVAGHAGLFAPVADLARLAACFLREGEGFVRPQTLRRFVKPADLVPGSSRCLGWHGIEENCSGGRYLAPGSYGHTGFTGTSIWIDPQNNRFTILLTNAVHPKRECKSRGFFAWRRAIHEAVYLALNLHAPA